MMDLFDKREASPMLIAQQMDAFEDTDWLYELKLDGFRCLAYIDYGMVDFRNKCNIRMLPRFPELKEIGYVTSGVTKEAIDTLEVTGKNPFLLMPIGEHDVIWVKTNHVCVVEYMPNLINSLRQLVFKGFRDDVLPKEVQASEA